MKNKLLVTLICMLLILPLSVSGEQINKDETVYVLLHPNGRVDNMQIVNHFSNVYTKEIIDYGPYSKVDLMGNNIDVENKGNKFIFNTSKIVGSDLYYSGTLKKDLPVFFNISYFLNNEQVSSHELGGAKGDIKIRISIKPNTLCESAYRNKFMTQIQIMLDMQKIKLYNSDGANSVVSGKYNTLTYTVLPGETKTYELKMYSDEFELNNINIVLMKYELEGLNTLESGISDINNGVLDLSNGTQELGTGLGSLYSGISEINSGINEINSNTQKLRTVMQDYKRGLIEYNNATILLADGIRKTASAIIELNKNASLLLGGYKELYNGLYTLKKGHEQLVQLASLLSMNPNLSIRAAGKGIIEEDKALSLILENFDTLNSKFSEYVTGINKLAVEAEKLNEEIMGLPDNTELLAYGFIEISSGTVKIFDALDETGAGLNTITTSMENLPDEVSKITNGQLSVSSALNQVKDKINPAGDNANKTVSFADNSREIKSLQFIVKVPSITKPQQSSTDTNVIEKLPWYKKLWNKIVNIFN